MHELDALLKPLIVKVAAALVFGLAALVSVPTGILISRRLFKGKSVKHRWFGTVMLTGALFLVTGATAVCAAAWLLVVAVIEPQSRRDCANALQNLARRGTEWAATHHGLFPADFTFLSDRTDGRTIIVDQTGVSDRDAVQQSYELVNPGIATADSAGIFIRCPLHEHAVRVDGTIVPAKTRP